MSNEGKQRDEGMSPGDDAALWQLLGRARTPAAGPYFSRRVLREVARLEQSRAAGMLGGWLARWRQAWRRPGAAWWPAVAAVAVFWLSVEWTLPSSAPGKAGLRVPSATAMAADGNRGETAASAASMAVAAEDAVAPQDVEVIADLDNVIAREENRLWTEDTARF